MASTVQMLGVPEIRCDGELRAVRGKKTWVLLARILISDRPLPRRQLAAEIFPEADDPLGAVRWSLSQVRRALRCSECLVGDPVVAQLPPDVVVDVLDPDLGSTDLVDLDRRLLDGIDGDWSPELDIWLAVERGRAESHQLAALHRETEIALARDELARARSAAQQLVRRAPLDESSHVMVIQALARSGQADAASDAVRACETLFRRELGCDPTPAVQQAARSTDSAGRMAVSPSASVRALLESGRAALDAGAIDAGVVCLRQAVSGAESGADQQLAAEVWCALGSALVHSTRGTDDEGGIALRRAADLALEVGDAAVATTAFTELGYAATLAGRRRPADDSFDQAVALAAEIDHQPADDPVPGILGFSAFNLSDWGRGPEAMDRFRMVIGMAEDRGQVRPLIFSLTLGARGLADLGNTSDAAAWLGRALDLISEERWLSFRPLARCLLHEIELAEGREGDQVRSEAEQTFSHSCQLGDPCWEAIAARVLGLTWADGHPDDAFSWFAEARQRAARVNDTWSWVHAASLHSEVLVAIDIDGQRRADAAARELLEYATHRQLDGFVDRAVAALSDRAVLRVPS